MLLNGLCLSPVSTEHSVFHLVPFFVCITLRLMWRTCISFAACESHIDLARAKVTTNGNLSLTLKRRQKNEKNVDRRNGKFIHGDFVCKRSIIHYSVWDFSRVRLVQKSMHSVDVWQSFDSFPLHKSCYARNGWAHFSFTSAFQSARVCMCVRAFAWMCFWWILQFGARCKRQMIQTAGNKTRIIDFRLLHIFRIRIPRKTHTHTHTANDKLCIQHSVFHGNGNVAFELCFWH